MGLAGDLMGRRRAMVLTNFFSAVGALGTALFTWGPPAQMYAIMGTFRFVLGVGVGGKYPLAATMSHEASSAPAGDTASTSTLVASPPSSPEAPASAARKSPIEVAKGFFWQTPGAVLPYVVALALLGLFGPDHHGAAYMSDTSAQFRIVLGLGAVPTVAAALLTWHSAESDDYTASRAQRRSLLSVARAHPELVGRLAGCGLSWALCETRRVRTYDHLHRLSLACAVCAAFATYPDTHLCYLRCLCCRSVTASPLSGSWLTCHLCRGGLC